MISQLVDRLPQDQQPGPTHRSPGKPRSWAYAAVSALALLGPAVAQATQISDFTGFYSTGNDSYTAVSTGPSTVSCGNGGGNEGNWVPTCTLGGVSSAVSATTNTLTITGPNKNGDPATTSSYFYYLITAPTAGTWSFNWEFQWNVDGNGNPSDVEKAGVSVNGVKTELAASSIVGGFPYPLTADLSGIITDWVLNAGDTFGFYVSSDGADSTAATLIITGFNAPDAAVPEPATLALFAWGAAGAFATRRRRTDTPTGA